MTQHAVPGRPCVENRRGRLCDGSGSADTEQLPPDGRVPRGIHIAPGPQCLASATSQAPCSVYCL